jgi:acetoin utilization protein AcuB
MHANMSVGEIMTREVVTVEKDDGLMVIREILDTRNFHHLIVMDKGSVCGIISFNDLSRAIKPLVMVDNGMPDVALTASDIMTVNPITINSDDSLSMAAELILTNRMHALPVMEKGELEGIITSHDILKECFS